MTDTAIRERLAYAAWRHDWDDTDWETEEAWRAAFERDKRDGLAECYFGMVDAVLSELETPTAAMVQAGVAAEPDGSLPDDPASPEVARAYVLAEWRAMLKAARE